LTSLKRVPDLFRNSASQTARDYRCQVWPLSAVIQISPALVTILPCCASENSMLVISPVSVVPDEDGSTRVQRDPESDEW
jgi:hypothetical protein